MKKVISIIFALLLTNACGSDDDKNNADTLEVESSISTGVDVCNKTVTCFDACGSNSDCAQKCFENQSGDDIEKSFILMTCQDTHADDCLTEKCQENECQYAVDICDGKKTYGCAEMLECGKKCFTERCENECQNIGTSKAVAHLDDIKTCVADYCSEATSDTEMSACVKTNCKGSLLACANN